MAVSLCSGPPSELERVLLQVLLHAPRQRQLLHAGRAPVDAQAAQVLQAGNAVLAAQRPDQLQVDRGRRHLLLQGRERRLGWVRSLGLVFRRAGHEIVLDEADHVREGQDAGLGQVVGVQAELAVGVLDAHVGGAPVGLDGQREQVAGVGAVPHQEGALRHLL